MTQPADRAEYAFGAEFAPTLDKFLLRHRLAPRQWATQLHICMPHQVAKLAAGEEPAANRLMSLRAESQLDHIERSRAAWPPADGPGWRL